ncbi:probable RNA helicase armi [Microplitis demolitor]|uniref:probable RNA helicase armi n=1 Tax=Microplitis demolitor TaxID=69319 RepID=UPI0004CD8EE6|nr:probable RNA helicase armi [Microplitis demolitor]
MFSLLVNAAKYIWGKTDDEPNIDEIISRLENFNDDNNDPLLEENDNHNIEGCFYKNGIITSITADTILIDDRYICDVSNAPINNLEKGLKVHYLAYQVSEDDIKVRKIISIINDYWDVNNDDSDVNKIEKNQMIRKSIVCKVMKRDGRKVHLEPINTIIDLDKINSTFVPYRGDWVQVESLVELNEDSGDLAGEVLDISKIQPLRSTIKIGLITKYDSDKGVGNVDNNMIFSKVACQPGYIPYVGDKVVCDSIESDQGVFTWRCLTVVPLIQVVNSRQTVPLVNNTSQINQDDLKTLLKNKNDIAITDDLSFDLEFCEAKELDVVVANNGATDCTLTKGVFMSKKSQSQLSLLSPEINEKIKLQPGDSVVYKFLCTAKFVGSTKELFIFCFNNFTIGRMFEINVNAKSVSAMSDNENKNYNSNRLVRHDVYDQESYIPGVRPCKAPNFIKVRSGVYRIPQRYWNIILPCINEKRSAIELEGVVGEALAFLNDTLTLHNYRDRFHALLYLEEMNLTIEMQKYDMDSAVMTHAGEYLSLKVPGLAEKRPSLIIGDRVIVSFNWDSSGGKIKNEGFVHKVKNSEVLLKFNPEFHNTYNGEDCQLTFKSSYSGLSRAHNAVNLAITNLGAEILFPTSVTEKESQIYLEENDPDEKPKSFKKSNQSSSSLSSSSGSTSAESTPSKNEKPKASARLLKLLSEIDSKEKAASEKNIDSDQVIDSCKSQIKKRKLIWFNKKLNYYQKEAVRNILCGIARPLPYVIFGPPGTGKTITLCEAILQILTTIPESRILIATPSNSSANLIAERLLDSNSLKPGDLVRLVAHHCLSDDSIPERLLPFCATGDLAAEGSSKRFEYSGSGPMINCTMSVLGRHRITIGTCIALGLLHNMGFPRGHFSHILVDEAGQATEPEIMVPLSYIHSDTGQIVLAGDPMQLGPVVSSRLAEHFGLAESYLVRLLQQFPYQRDNEGFEMGYDPRLITKLVINYRSLPEILELPNSLFYDSELVSNVSSTDSPEAEILRSIADELPSRDGQPPAVVFHGVNGENRQDSDSPSWYNPAEATQVYLYLLKLYKRGFNENDIGIITPYQKQVAQIRSLLWELDMQLPKVGSVEEFQGQERKIIILSTVRSCNNFVSNDARHALGFVASPRRLNVAITRPRALLIIIGNPFLLAKDPCWRSVLTYCLKNDSYTGCNFSMSCVDDTDDPCD